MSEAHYWFIVASIISFNGGCYRMLLVRETLIIHQRFLYHMRSNPITADLLNIIVNSTEDFTNYRIQTEKQTR